MHEAQPSQTLKATFGLRGLITSGQLQPGERISEQSIADRLGVSRTPARSALIQLKQEGLLEELPSGGFVVSEFTEADVFDAIEVRGTLEGLSARFAAERGVSPATLMEMEVCLRDLDKVMPALAASAASIGDFIRLNDRFHELLLGCAKSAMVNRALRNVLNLPFAGLQTFVEAPVDQVPELHKFLVAGHAQHHDILDAIRNREGTRAQALTLEHARSSWKYLRLVLRNRDSSRDLPALRLIRLHA
ncbi:MAG: GntR family transcriptional regulator [Candidatus Odyssella sp.]|nr:GntR family transcriptional regulator [Candidatus Odyssella sp.]